MGASSSQSCITTTELRKQNRIILSFAVIALIAAIIGCMIGLYNYYTFSLQQTNINFASVPGQTDCVGNLRITGDTTVQSWQEAISETVASLTTRGGIGSVGKIKSGKGMFANKFDSLSEDAVLAIGRETNVGIEMGKSDFPTEIHANKLTLNCPQTILKQVEPQNTDSYSLGSALNQWQDLHLSRNIVNKNGFITKPGSSGIYNQLKNGPKLIGTMSTPFLLHLESILAPETDAQKRSFPLSSFVTGDILELNLRGTFSMCDTIKPLQFVLTLNNAEYYIVGLENNIFSHLEMYYEHSFTIKIKFYQRDTGLTIMTKTKFDSEKSQELQLLDINIIDNQEQKLTWDIKVDRSNHSIGSDGFILCQFCEMHKVY